MSTNRLHPASRQLIQIIPNTPSLRHAALRLFQCPRNLQWSVRREHIGPGGGPLFVEGITFSGGLFVEVTQRTQNRRDALGVQERPPSGSIRAL